jgi:hypothetical protein
MLHILTKVKIVIMSIIDSIRICNVNSNESEIILIHFINKKSLKTIINISFIKNINKKIIKVNYKHILSLLFIPFIILPLI